MPHDSLRVVVVDDEPLARKRVMRLLAAHDEFVVVAECAGGQAAISAITEMTPDVVFLDIQMPDLDGFQVLEGLAETRLPEIIFVTAFDEYAVRAFDHYAIDYLLKPYTEERFDQALERVRARLIANSLPLATEQIRALLSRMGGADRGSSLPQYQERVAVRVNGRTKIIPIADVDWFQTDGNYMRVYVGGRSHLIRNTAARMEAMLDPQRFARIHRRYIVNLDRVAEVEPWLGGDAIIHLKDGGKLRLSRSYRDAFHARMLGDHSSSNSAAAIRPPASSAKSSPE